MAEWTATKLNGKTAIEVNGLVWRGSQFFSGPDNDDLDRAGILGRAIFERDGYRVIVTVLPDESPMHDIYDSEFSEDTSFVGVTASAYRKGVELGSDSLWGIGDPSDTYLTEIARECATAAISEARETLKALIEDEEV